MMKPLHVSATVFVLFAVSIGLAPTASMAADPSEWGSGTVISVRDCSGQPLDLDCFGRPQTFELAPFLALLETGGPFVAVDAESSSGFSIGASQVSFSSNPLDAPIIRSSAFSSPAGLGDTRVGATTGAYQGFTYEGTEEAVVTFNATLEFVGASSSTYPGPGAATISAEIALFETDIVLDDGLAECPLLFCVGGTILDFDDILFEGPFDGSKQSAQLRFDVSLSPGESFFIGAAVQAIGERGASMDAFNTLNTFFTGDPVVLTQLSPATRTDDPVVDIRPLSPKNRIRPGGRGLIPVAVFGSESFDAQQIDVSSVRFGPGGAKPISWLVRARDINRDGFSDLIMTFVNRKTGIQCADFEARVTGDLYSGDSFSGVDSIKTVRCD